jgi:CHAT domain-containing protein
LQRSMMVLAGANHRVHHVVDYLVNGQLLSPDETSKQKPVGQELEREISDGLLTAYKVVGMNLTGTDLVVLAGCESGLGVSVDSKLGTGIKQESESVVGLRQAFTMAGARSVVTSMWDVPLDATVQQISAFLNAWLSHEHPRYQAFHESQLNVLHAARNNKQGGHPFWWAGFIYFGDPGDR